MKTRRTSHSSRARSLGFTLVELMVSIGLGMLLMVALGAVYLNVSRANSEMAKTNALIENGRFAIDIISEDLSHTGFWGGFVPDFDNFILRTSASTTTPTQAALDLGPCLAYGVAWTDDYKNTVIGAPIASYDGVPPDCSSVVANRKANTDVLVVRHLENCALGSANCHCLPSDTACYDSSLGGVYFQASFCQNELATAGYKYRLSATAADFTLKARGCSGTPPTTTGTLTSIRKLVTNIYYIRTYSTTTGDGIPTLVRATYGNGAMATPVALIEGIESFKVEFGLDEKSKCNTNVDYTVTLATGATGNIVRPTTCAYDATTATNNTVPTVRGDGVPESYVRCGSTGCTVGQLMNVVAVKLYVLARTLDASTATGHADTKTYTMGSSSITSADYNAAYKRHVFQTTVRLHNVSGRRETPTSP